MEFSQVPAARAVQCPQCRQALPGDHAGLGAYERCPGCGSKLQVWRFPALRRPPEDLSGQMGTLVALPGEASCFFHTEKRASVACERCGRFICTLCDLQVGARHLCPSCIGNGLESDKVPELVTRRLAWPSLALLLGWVPMVLFFVMWPFFVATGPAAVFAGIWGWKKPGSVVRGPRRGAAILGIIGGLLQISILVPFSLGVWEGIQEGMEEEASLLHFPETKERMLIATVAEEHPVNGALSTQLRRDSQYSMLNYLLSEKASHG